MSKFNFDHLRIENATARFPIPAVCPGAVLIMRPATADNGEYTGASLKHAAARKRAIDDGDTALLIKLDREDDRALYGGNVVVGWEGVVDESNEPVAFSIDNCTDFLSQLPTWQFEQIRGFAIRPANFTKARPAPVAKPAAVAGN